MAYSGKVNKKILKQILITLVVVISLGVIFAKFKSNNDNEMSISKSISNVNNDNTGSAITYQEAFDEHVLLYSSFETEGANGLPIDDISGNEYSTVVTNSIANSSSNKKSGNKSCYFSGTGGQRLRYTDSNLNFARISKRCALLTLLKILLYCSLKPASFPFAAAPIFTNILSLSRGVILCQE